MIDLGNLVFDQLKANHGETEESRMLFLYNLTQKQKWLVFNSNHWILIEASGIVKNFFDPVIDSLNSQWIALKASVDYARLENIIKKMRAEYDRPAPRDGDLWEFGSGQGPFKEIKI